MLRRSFIVRTLGVIGLSGFATAVLNACGQIQTNTDDDEGGGSCSTDGTVASIGDNHGHILTVSAAAVAAGAAKTYNIQGSSGHTHSVTVTAAHFASLQDGVDVSITSTSGSNHTHTVTLRCA